MCSGFLMLYRNEYVISWDEWNHSVKLVNWWEMYRCLPYHSLNNKAVQWAINSRVKRVLNLQISQKLLFIFIPVLWSGRTIVQYNFKNIHIDSKEKQRLQGDKLGILHKEIIMWNNIQKIIFISKMMNMSSSCTVCNLHFKIFSVVPFHFIILMTVHNF